MAYKEPKIEKMFYTIGEVAKIFGESTSLIRFWANKFAGIIDPKKNKKGNRLFTRQDLNSFKTIHHLIRDRGLTLEGAKRRMEDNREGEDRSREAIEYLKSIRQMLLEVKEMM